MVSSFVIPAASPSETGGLCWQRRKPGDPLGVSEVRLMKVSLFRTRGQAQEQTGSRTRAANISLSL